LSTWAIFSAWRKVHSKSVPRNETCKKHQKDK
jgi:hypothetical protein